jgi:parallel beta helix pectate lyase-like protein
VVIPVGANAQSVVNSHPAGTTFTIATGRHGGWSVQPLAGDVFIGQPGAILDGDHTTAQAFFTQSTNDVTVEGTTAGDLLVEDYTDGNTTMTTVEPGLADKTSGWVFKYLEVANNIGEGIGLSSNKMIVEHCYVHDNGQLGMGGAGTGSTVEYNTVDHNGYQLVAPAGFESGGVKTEAGLRTANAPPTYFEYNKIDDNATVGFHTDVMSSGVVFEHNEVENNGTIGVRFEISNQGLAANNTISGNKIAIAVDASWDIQILDNTLSGNGQGIVLGGWSRPQCVSGTCAFPGRTGTNDITVTGNTVADSGLSGGPQAPPGTTATWSGNTFTGANTLAWGSQRGLSLDQWHALGFG